jgi:Peptidase C13 family
VKLLQTIIEGARLSVGVRPRGGANYSGWGCFALLSVLHMVASALYSLRFFDGPVSFSVDGAQSEALDLLLTLLLALALARWFQRAAHGLALANLLLGALLIAELYFQFARDAVPPAMLSPMLYELQFWVWVALVALLTNQALRWLRPDVRALRLLPAATLFALLTVLPWRVLTPQFFWTERYDEAAMAEEAYEPAFDAEKVMFEQSARVGAAVDALAPQRPGVTDLYLITFGADGAEDVFRNEAEFVGDLFAQRFGAKNRVVKLINNPDTTAKTPLATMSNLRYALALLETTMDPKEDILMLFATTHGSEDHWLAVDLEPLPLNPISAKGLGQLLRKSPFEHQVVVISACYSGGFLPELKRPGSLVITAARSDRTSFGCGADSDITYFGRAFFANALNQTDSFFTAFDQAKIEVTEREKEIEGDPSEPQIASNPQIEAKLEQWRAGFELGAAVKFEVAR